MKLLLLVGVLGVLVVSTTGAANYHWDYPTAYTMAQYSSAVYCEKEELLEWNCAVCVGETTGFELRSYFEDKLTGEEAMVGVDVDSAMIVMSIEGTHDLEGTITDLEIIKTDLVGYPNAPSDAKIHRGFDRAYHAIQRMVEEDVTALVEEYPDFPVYVTGHSLGGALATLAALDLTVLKPKIPVHVYTFGAPRVGNDAFQLYFQSQIANSIRVVHEKDIVPHLPFRFLGYHHAPLEVWEQHGNYTVCNGSGEDPACSDSVLIPSPADHAYVVGCREGCDGRERVV